MANNWEERVKQAGFVRRTMFQQGTTFGRSRPSFGDIELVNSAALDATGDLDFLNDLALDGRSITIYYGDTTGIFPADFTALYTASMEQALVARERVTIRVLGNAARVDQPFRTTFFGGSGGVDGSPSLANKPKPYTFGRVNNVSPVLLDSDFLLYQVHESAFDDLTVYGDGLEIPLDDEITLVQAPVPASIVTQFFPEIDQIVVYRQSGIGAYDFFDVTTDYWATQTAIATDIDEGNPIVLFDITFDGSIYYALKSTSTASALVQLMTSTDLSSWTNNGNIITDALTGGFSKKQIIYNADLGQYLLYYRDGSNQTVILNSDDGLSWSESVRLPGGSGSNSGLIWAGGSEQRYILFKETDEIWESADGLTWSEISGAAFPTAQCDFMDDLYYDENTELFYGRGDDGFAVSADLISWTLERYEVGIGQFYSFGVVRADDEGRLIIPYSIQDTTVSPNVYTHYADISTDGVTWQQVQLNSNVQDRITWLPLFKRWLVGGAGLSYSPRYMGYVFSDYKSAADAERDESIPSAGTHKTYTAGGIFRLADTQTGTVTADVTVGATAADRTVAKAFVNVMDYVGESYNSNAVDTLDSLVPYECGFYLDSTPTETAVILDDIANSVGAFWGDDSTGIFTIAQVNDPEYIAATTTVYDYDMTKPLERLQTQDAGRGIPFWRVALNYNRRYTTQEIDLASGITAARREELAQAYDTVEVSDAAIRTQHLLAPELLVNTLLLDESDVSTEAQRLFDLRSVKRDRYEFEIKLDDNTVDWDVGDVIEVVHPRFGLSGGKNFVIIGLTINPGPQTLTVNIWG